MIISISWINIQWLIWSTILCTVSCYFSAHLASQPYKHFNNQQNQELYSTPTIPLTQSILLELTCSLMYTSCKFAHIVVFVAERHCQQFNSLLNSKNYPKTMLIQRYWEKDNCNAS